MIQPLIDKILFAWLIKTCFGVNSFPSTLTFFLQSYTLQWTFCRILEHPWITQHFFFLIIRKKYVSHMCQERLLLIYFLYEHEFINAWEYLNVRIIFYYRILQKCNIEIIFVMKRLKNLLWIIIKFFFKKHYLNC